MNPTKTFTSKRKVYQFEYPADWQIFIADDVQTVITASHTVGSLPPAVHILTNEYERPLSDLLDELYTNVQKKPGFLRLSHPRLFTLSDGKPAGDILYQHAGQQEPITQRDVMIHFGGSQFVSFLAFTPNGQWNEYETRFENILNSLRVPDAAPVRSGFFKRLSDKLGR